MKMKKLLSVLLTICMIVQILPMISAGATEVSTEVTGNINYIINDTFDDGDLGNWELGISDPDSQNLSIEDGALKLTGAPKTGNAFNTGYQPIVRNDFEKITFSKDKKIVLKARIKHSVTDASGNADVRLQANRPNIEFKNSYSGSELTNKPYTILRVNQNSVKATEYNARDWRETTLVTENMSDNWVDVEAIFDGSTYTRNVTLSDGTKKSVTSNSGYTVSAKTATTEGGSYNGTLHDDNYSVYEAAGYDTASNDFAGFTSLDSISFMFGAYANEFYIDYIQLYEISPVELTAEVAETMQYDEAITVTFSGADEINVPLDAVTLTTEDGEAVEANNIYDATIKTLTITPSKNLTLGGKYKVNIDKSKLEGDMVKYMGESSFTVIAKDRDGLIIYDTFDDGDLGNWKLGTSKAASQSLTVENGALKFSGAPMANNAFGTGSQAIVRNDLAEKITFSADKKIALKAKIKHAAPSSSANVRLQANRPDDISKLVLSNHELTLKPYTILNIKQDSVKAAEYNARDWRETTLVTENMSDNWIDVEVIFDGSTYTREVKFSDETKKFITSKSGYTVSAKTATAEGGSYNGTLHDDNYSVYEAAGYDTTASDFKGFTTLDSLSFMFGPVEDTLYIDEIKLYEVKTEEITAEVSETMQYDEPIAITFSGADEINVPLDAVTLTTEDGTTVEAENTYDADTKTLMIAPVNNLKLGNSYKINIDASKLEDDFVKYTGETSFTVIAKDRDGLIIYDTFDDGDLGNWKLGTSKAASQSLTIEDGALKFSGAPMANNAFGTGSQAIVRNDLAEKITFSADKKIALKAKIKHAAPSSSANVRLQVNRPDDISKLVLSNHELTLQPYTVLRVKQDSVKATKYNARDWDEQTLVTENMSDNWVDIEVIFDGSTYTREVKFSDGTKKFITSKSGYTVSAKTATAEGGSYNGTLHDDNYSVYEAAGYDTTASDFKGFTTLDSLSFMFGPVEDTLYIDEIKLYEVKTEEITAEVSETMQYDEPIAITFSGADEINVPLDAVTLTTEDGTTVEAENAYDADTKTLMIAPVNNLKLGNSYKINIDASKLENDFVKYTGETSFTVVAKDRDGLIIYDTFDDGDLGNWKLGTSKAASQSLTVENGALKFSGAPMANNAFGTGSQAIVRNDLAEKITFSADKKIALKAKIKHAAPSSSANVRFQANRPDDISKLALSNHELTLKPYTILNIKQDSVKATKYNARDWDEQTLVTENMSDNWIDVEVIFDGSTYTREVKFSDETKKFITSKSGYTVSAKTATAEGGSYNGTLHDDNYSVYEAAGYDTTASDFKGFTTLDSLSFMFGPVEDTLYIDEIKLYEIKNSPGYALMPAGNTVKYDEAIELKFFGVNDVFTFPENAVTLKNAAGAKVETTSTFNNETSILSIKPAQNLTKGEYYSVNVNKSALTAIAMDYVGTTYFTVTARDDFETGRVILDDNFDDNTTQGWAPGNALENYGATVTAEDGMLHVKAVGMGYGTGNESTVTKLLGDGIELAEGKKVVIKTKVKNVTEGAAWVLNLNKPEDLNNLSSNINLWGNYQLVKNTSTDILVPANKREPLQGPYNNYVWGYSIGKKELDDEGDVVNKETIDTLGKWVEYTITITDEEINNLHVKADILDDDGNVVATYESDELNNATIKTAFDAYERVFGKVPGYSTVEDAADPEKKAVMDNMYSKWLSADRLTFSTGKYNVPMEYYVDYIKVEQLDARNVPTTATASLTVNGESTTTISAGDVVIPSFALQGNTGTTFTVISAMYVDGVLSGTPHIEVLTAENADEFTYVEATGFTVPQTGDVVIKAFVWDALDGLKPVSQVAEATDD